ncbi:type II secretion system secretin GspD [Phyllobacterium sp. 21LDTY02-6]|uniref:type II secretion system secretin GspD n=1 Tax=Phyllobacterium sp. 21LDTY02-6 TaxID=2944903 RepID=UPI0020204B13|nr:type II secretion system secretin GspD [Phyllobacterium sp. 21LDTY02-6]MCO4318886.1 type II secretion system secretin GspD [Phyllobacterium sp. 21LDTY02-6]
MSARKPSGGGFLSKLGLGRAQNNRQGEVYYGYAQQLTAGERKSLERLSGGEFEVNLDEAEIKVAARTVLGEVLGISYTIDPRVAGRVSITTSKPMPAPEILSMFESALRSNGVAMVRESDRLRLMPANEALGAAELDRGTTIQPGYGATVLPLKHVAASTILPLLENFVARAGMVREDPGGNALIFQGTATERTAAIEAARSFDQDWMADQSVGIFPVNNSSAEAMMPELNRVLDIGEGGRGRNTIRVQVIERSNAILVVAKTRNQLQRAASWIKRLDRLDAAAANLRVYKVQHLQARRLASMVNEIFNGGSASSASEDPASQFPPGSQFSLGSQADGQNQGATGSQPAVATPDQRMADELPNAGGETPAPAAGNTNSSQGGVHITANPENNTILVYARPDQQRLIEQALVALDRPQEQVAIEATIAEVTLTNELRYGVQFFLKSNDLGLGGDKGSGGLVKEAGKAVLSRTLPGFNLLLGPETEPRVVIDALRGVAEVKVLSSPSVVVLDNKPAVLQVGDEIPIVTRTAQSVTDPEAPVVNNVEFRNTGVILNVLPRITGNGTINLVIQQEISSVQRSQAQSLTPTISQRKVSSTVSVTSGQTVMLGGLINERQQRGRDGVPVLGDLPLIGDAFRSNQNSATRTELIILIRTQVIRDSLDAQHVAEQMRSELRLMNEPSKNMPLRRPAKTMIE